MIRDPRLLRLNTLRDMKRRKQAGRRRKQRNNKKYVRRGRYRYPMWHYPQTPYTTDGPRKLAVCFLLALTVIIGLIGVYMIGV